ncbi:MAG: metalloregulator ArsR/SmtB family transcription factor [Candidatus Coatesbacteria bacterium]|nr:metalloregulator ArsR/SmtB family transcription factor [Candidatus Coatesbacteria bacterium]
MTKLAQCDELARHFKALGHPTRLRIVGLLSLGMRCVEEIRRELGLKQPNISQHLAVLRQNGIVNSERDGNRVCYSLANPDLIKIIVSLGNCMGVGQDAPDAGS